MAWQRTDVHGDVVVASNGGYEPVQVAIYSAGTKAIRNLAADECLQIDSFVISIYGTGTHVTFVLSELAPPESGEFVFWGVLPTNGIFGHSFGGMPRLGAPGQNPYVATEDAAAIGVMFTGKIIKAE